MVFDVSAQPVSEIILTLPGNEASVIAAVSCAVDLRLLALSGGEVARSAPGAGVLSYTPFTTSGYRLVVLRSGPGSPATCNIERNHVAVASGVPVGGITINLNGLRAGEVVETVRQPNGAGPTHVAYLLSGGIMQRRVVGGGTDGAVAFTVAAGDAGNRQLVVGALIPSLAGGPLRVVRNDAALAGHDIDADGLGDELEVALGTCSRRNYTLVMNGVSFNCATARDARDTDGDGIRDAWEVLGRRDMQPHQPLPLWGASARHKDLFVEVDFKQLSAGEATVKLPAVRAREIAAMFAGTTGVDEGPVRRAQQAATLRNPDGQAGIAAHLDTGLAPTMPADATIFGNWGGFEVLPPGSVAGDVWTTRLAEARRGIFRYALGYNACSGQQGNWFPLNLPTGCSNGFAHELGHGLGLTHPGVPADVPVAPNCKPNYPSVMNYGSYSVNVGFSDGAAFPPIDNSNVRETGWFAPGDPTVVQHLTTFFDYNIDLATGSVDWNRDGYYAPANATVRANANNQRMGQCEGARYNQSVLHGDVFSIQEPAVARLNGRIYALVSFLGVVRASWSDSSFNCPVNTPCGTWSDPAETPLVASGGIDAVSLAGAGGNHILVATIDAQGRLWSSELRTGAAGPVFTPAVQIATPAGVTAQGAPALATMDGVGAYLAYRGSDGLVHTNLRFYGGAWQVDQIARLPSGTAIAMSSLASPAIARAYTDFSPALNLLYGAFPDIYGAIHLYAYEFATGFWRDTALAEYIGPVRGRPSMVWQNQASYDGVGVLQVFYTNTSGVARQARTFRRLIPQPNGTFLRQQALGMDSAMTNNDLKIYGADLLWDSQVDANLRALVVNATGNDNAKIQFWPMADGVVSGSYANRDDWAVMGQELCRHTASAGGTAPSPVTCW